MQAFMCTVGNDGAVPRIRACVEGLEARPQAAVVPDRASPALCALQHIRVAEAANKHDACSGNRLAIELPNDAANTMPGNLQPTSRPLQRMLKCDVLQQPGIETQWRLKPQLERQWGRKGHAPWNESREARPCSRSDMVMSQGSMPAAWMADAISRSPLLPSSLSTATRTCTRSSAIAGWTGWLSRGRQRPAVCKPPTSDAHPAAAMSASARHRVLLRPLQLDTYLRLQVHSGKADEHFLARLRGHQKQLARMS